MWRGAHRPKSSLTVFDVSVQLSDLQNSADNPDILTNAKGKVRLSGISGHICEWGSATARDAKWIKIDEHVGIAANERCHTLIQLAISRSSA